MAVPLSEVPVTSFDATIATCTKSTFSDSQRIVFTMICASRVFAMKVTPWWIGWILCAVSDGHNGLWLN